jgi:hypothetical protein
MYNTFIYTTFFYLGLNFTHLSESESLSAISLDFSADSVLLDVTALIALLILFALIVTGLIAMVYMWIEAQILQLMFAQFLFYAFLFLMFSLYFFNKRSVHLHHWTFSFICASFLNYNHWIPCIFHALASGSGLEGGYRWGFDPVWKTIDDYNPNENQNKKGEYADVEMDVPSLPTEPWEASNEWTLEIPTWITTWLDGAGRVHKYDRDMPLVIEFTD